MTDTPNVTQADREAAEDVYYSCFEEAPNRAWLDALLAGKHDGDCVVQHLARHREQTTAAIVAWLRDMWERGEIVCGDELADAIERGQHITAQEPTDEQ